MRGQAFDLLDVENRVALHEGNIALGFLAGSVVGFGARDLGGINDQAALLAFADMGVQFKRLLEGHPVRRGVSLRHGGRPQHHDIDSPVGNAVGAQRPRDAACGVFGVPRLEPRADALFQLADDLVGDLGINILFHCLPLFGLRFAHANRLAPRQ